ncbi:MAG: hypothetical protein CEE42_05915 [Promethearchaeota archaeon Loki_b31]|nr:MAG: hypothetical protein CEE42_05915 [Candidatus Lokiarchaeota archaeon Loki_b31]
MIIISKNLRKLGDLSIILVISSFICLFNFTTDLNINFIDRTNLSQDHEPNNDFELELSDASSLFKYSGVGKAQNVTEYGEGYFLNNNINVTNNENASVIIPNDWEGNAILCDVTNLYEYGAVVMNQTFDNGIDQNRWTNRTTGNPTKFTVGHYNNPTGSNDSIYLKLDEDGGNWQDTSSLINYSFPLLRENIPYEDWYIKYSVKWIMTDNSWRELLPPGSKYVMGLEFSYNDGSSTLHEFDLKKPADIVNDTWYPITMLNLISPFPELYEYDPPANVSIYFSFGVKNAAYNPVGSLTIYYDNISFEIQSIPKPSTIDLNITDNASGGLKNQPIQDFPNLFGKGNISLEGNWSGEVGGSTHEFSFSSNSTGNVLVNTNFFVMASSLGYTTTNIGSTGSEFIVENGTNTIWTMNIPISIPGSYSMNYYFNVSKPLNWNVTQVIDPYSNNRINEVIGAGLGNSTLTIPNNIITGGVWKIVAEAPNYVELANLFRKDASIWCENDTFHIDDKLRINASIKLIPSIDNTKATLKIFSPNGSLWYQEGNISVDINGNVGFSEIRLGTSNASTGKYSAQIIWHDHDINMSQVGFSLLQFNVIHKTNLTAVDPYFEQVAGDPLLIKVRFLDDDINESVHFASVKYNSTFGASGVMGYLGSGVYFIDIDTSSLGLGDYYFSFNASKSFYENQTKENIIHLKIIAQPLALEVPSAAINAMANSYAICQVNVTGAISGALIPGDANITTDWDNPYQVTNDTFGTFTLNFSTIDIPTQGVFESFTITVFANKTDYGATTGFITLIVNPIQTIADANKSIVNAYLNEVIDLKVNYTIEDSNELISGANCSVEWEGASNIVSVADGFIISLDTKGLSTSHYTALIKLEHIGYANAFKSVTIIISEQNVNLKVVINSLEVGENSLVETSYNKVITLSCRAYAALEQIYLSGGTITFINEQYEQSLVEYDNSWFSTSILISTSTFSLGINYVYIRFQQDNYTTTTFSFQILVNQIEFDVQTIDFQDSIEVNTGEKIQIRINLTEFGTMNFIENAIISYSWDFGLGNFEEIGDGIYELELVIPENIRGNYKITLIILKEGTVYKTTQYSFLLVVKEPEFPIIWIGIILAILAAIISVLGILSLRAYVFLPKKKKRDLELQQRIQLFKDVWNIQAFLVIHKKSGLPIYNKKISILKNKNETIISGFIQAISIFSEALVDGDTLVTKINDAHQDKYSKNVFELDFKYFYLLVCEYEAIRAILIIKERSSNRLRKQLYLLAVAIYALFPEKLEHFMGSLPAIKDGIDVLLNQFLFLYYYEPFSLTNNESYFSKIKNSGDLTTMETRIINVILSEFKSEKFFKLNTLVGSVHEENKDLVLDGIRSLIKRKILVSPYLNKFSPKINRN